MKYLKVYLFFLFIFTFSFISSSQAKSLPLPDPNIPDNPPLQSSVILPDGRRFLLDYFDDVKVFWDKKEKKFKTNRPGWWIINYPFEKIEGFEELSEKVKSKVFSVRDLKGIKNWYIYTPGKPYIINFKPTGPAPIKIHKNPTIIVNNSSPKANDENSGTKEKPLKTISKAIEKAKPGDIIQVFPGIYRETLKITKSGTKEKPIVIEGVRDKDGRMPIISGNDILPLKWEIYDKKRNIFRAEIPMNIMGKLIEEKNNLAMKEVDKINEMKENTYIFNWSSKEFIQLSENFENQIVKEKKEVKEGDVFNGVEWKKIKVDKDGFIDFEKVSNNGKNSVFAGISYVYCDKEVKGRIGIPGGFRGARMTGTGFSAQLNRYYLWINNVFVKGTEVYSTYENHFYKHPRHWPYYGRSGDRIDGFKLKKGWNTLYFVWDTNTYKNLKFKFNFPKKVKLICSVEKELNGNPENFITEYLISGPFPSKCEKAVYVCLEKGKTPKSEKISIPARGNPLVSIGTLDRIRKIDSPARYVQFRGFEIQGGGQFQQRGSVSVYGSGNLIEGCLIDENVSGGIGVSNRDGLAADPNIIRNNWVINPGNVGIGAQHTSEFLTPQNQSFKAPGRGRNIIEYNYIRGANWLTISTGWQAGGMKLFRLTNCIIRYNTIENCPSQGIWLDWEHYNNRLEGNLIRNCLLFGIGIEASPGPNLVVNNIITGLKPIGPSSVWFRYGILAWATQRTWAINNTIDGKWDTTPAWQNKTGTDGILLRMNKKSKRNTKWEGNYAPDLMMNNLILGCKVAVVKGEGDFVENNFYERGKEMSFLKRYYPEKAKGEKTIEKELKIENLIDRENNDYRIRKDEFPKSDNKNLTEFIKPYFTRYDFYGLLRFPENDTVGATRKWDGKVENTIIEIDFYDGRMVRETF